MAPAPTASVVSEKGKAIKNAAPSSSAKDSKAVGLDMTDIFENGDDSDNSDFNPGYHGTMTDHQDRLHNKKVRAAQAPTPAASVANASKKSGSKGTAKSKAKGNPSSANSKTAPKDTIQPQLELEQNASQGFRRRSSSSPMERPGKKPRGSGTSNKTPPTVSAQSEQSTTGVQNPPAAKPATQAQPHKNDPTGEPEKPSSSANGLSATEKAMNDLAEAIDDLNINSLRAMLTESIKDTKEAQDDVNEEEENGAKKHTIQKSKVDLAVCKLTQAMLQDAADKKGALMKQKTSEKKLPGKGKKNE
ncbi:hypothetical protein HII31_08072 [Pseudocercospora fuligena]|uniref:Uncharacterized protein n=1 Tax=Pseudocercospora fuligena TaxID=685502 RepID=A0A8H6RHC4_9PEZI|nr:hypothetical protein HII31_08072 [Pseudocercospora fuligena]